MQQIIDQQKCEPSIEKNCKMNRWKYVFNLASKIKHYQTLMMGVVVCNPTRIGKEGLATLFAEWKDSEMDLKLTPEIVLKVFKRISDEDVTFMGFVLYGHVRME
jgi:hypothetical protein